jgi:hypothetical protein
MVFFNVLKDIHLMVSIPYIEMHNAVYPPPLPPTPPYLPHLSIAPLCVPPWGGLTGKPNGDILADVSRTLSQGTDIGPLIPHIHIPMAPPNVLLAVIFLTSGSKSHFGASRHVLPKGPTAFAVMHYASLNLNCAGYTWPPLPSGLVASAWATNVTGVSVGDFVAGFAHMIFDALVQFGLNRFFNSSFMSSVFERLTFKLFGPLAMRYLGFTFNYHVGEWLSMAAGTFLTRPTAVLFGRAGAAMVDNIIPTAVALLVGSPVGYSPGFSPVGGGDLGQYQPQNIVDRAHTGLTNIVDDLFNDNGVDDYGDYPTPSTSEAPA